jgi:hypothetical protein
MTFSMMVSPSIRSPKPSMTLNSTYKLQNSNSIRIVFGVMSFYLISRINIRIRGALHQLEMKHRDGDHLTNIINRLLLVQLTHFLKIPILTVSLMRDLVKEARIESLILGPK